MFYRMYLGGKSPCILPHSVTIILEYENHINDAMRHCDLYDKNIIL